MDESPIVDYYRKRAAQSDGTYGPPEIQPDFQYLANWLQQNVAHRDVLEVACGTGHWTKVAAATARRILASDISSELVHAARRETDAHLVDFMVADACKLPVTPNTFNCGMAHFLMSHIPRPDICPFIGSFSRYFTPGSRMLFSDTKWVEGYRLPIARRDKDGNTYDIRTLKDGSQYEILKNYLTSAEWREYLEPFGIVHIEELTYIWAVRLELKRS